MMKPKYIVSRSLCIAALAFGLALQTASINAQPITVANHSFESQLVNPFFFIDTRIDNWQKAPQPGYFTNSPQLSWDQTAGMFIGTPPFSPNPYSNLHGNQSAYMLSLPGTGIFQDNVSLDWNSTIGGLNATYQPGFAYELKLGVFGKSMTNDVSMMSLSLYYRDSGNMITVGAPTIVTFNTSTFNPAGPFTLLDVVVTTPIVQAGDAWAGKNIGIRIDSLFGLGGYWDMDNVRLAQVVPEPTALSLLALGLGSLLVAGGRTRRKV